MDRNARTTPPRVVSLGGGHGQSVLLAAVKELIPSITAIVTTFDSGGSSGALSREFGFPSLGDIRRCLIAMAPEDDKNNLLTEAMEYRFPLQSSLRGHPVGNLILASMAEQHGNIYDAVNELAIILKLTGRVVPVASEYAELVAHLKDGSDIRGEAQIDTRSEADPQITGITLSHDVNASPVALAALATAELIVLGPGDLYTSVLPNLLPKGMRDAIAKTKAKVVYVCNLMTKRGETDGYTATDFAARVCDYTGRPQLDCVMVNNATIPPDSLAAYATENATPVKKDSPNLERYARHIVEADFLDISAQTATVRHSAKQLRSELRKLLLAEHT